MRRTFIILALAALSAYAVDCIRATFNYILIERSYWEFTPDDLYIDSSYSQNKSMVNISKFFWSGAKLDSIKMHMSCRDNRKDWTVAKDWKVSTEKQGKVTKYIWTEPMPMSLTKGKDSLNFQIGDQHYMPYIQNDTLFEKIVAGILSGKLPEIRTAKAGVTGTMKAVSLSPPSNTKC